ncbi:MAG: hypothetical protein V4795_14225 [Pseudomonadota bacterium]
MAERMGTAAAAAHPPTGARAPAASAAGQVLAGMVGLGCAALATWAAQHHPLSPALALAGVLLLAAGQAAWPPLWLIALPALLPWLGLGAWSGWLVAEEMDLAVLAVAAGAYLRWALRPGPRLRASRASRRVRAWGQLLLLLWTASVLVAMQRGALDAGGWSFGWWQGLREPLNALRLAKPTLAVLLLLPLWWRLQQRPGQRCADQLSLGLALALAGTTLWCLWERLAFTGLLNMATDYRTTGPFWETHAGGAALDICLALSLPFALRLAGRARSPWGAAAAGLVVLGGVYAALTTFSRIVYLAIPVAVLLLWWLQRRQDAAAPAAAQHPGGGLRSLLLLALGLAGLGAWLFPSAGYRGLLALLGNAVLLLLLAPRSLRQSAGAWVGAWMAGLLLAGLLALLALQLPKGAYLAYAAVTLATAAWLLLAPARATAWWLLAGAGFVAQLGCTVLVAVSWGGSAAWPAATAAAGLLGLAWVLLGRRTASPWPTGLPWLVRSATGLAVLLAGVAVFGAGDYMAGRLVQTEADRAGRWDHWRDGLALNRGGAALWLGQGLGRYADLYALHNRPDTRPGDIRLVAGEGGPAMRLVAGNHVLGHGELLRLSQRIGLPPATGLKVELQLRSAAPVQLRVELCNKHLLYDGICRSAAMVSQPGNSGWQTLQQALPDAELAPDMVPRLRVFSVASETAAQPLDLRRITLTDASGRQWLHNSDFSAGAARWFSTSDRNHLPWHAKNMAVHLVVEQGLLGLLALLALTVGALAAVLGPLRRHPLAPVLAAAIVGCWVVGSVDSVLDLPRVATWLLLLSAMAMQLHLPSRARQPGGPA